MADGRGIRIMRVEGVGKVSLINLVDVVSRLKAESYPSLETSNPALPDYQLAFRRAFLTHGLPETLTLDHGTVFYDNTTPSPFPTRLHVWLIAAFSPSALHAASAVPPITRLSSALDLSVTAQARLAQAYPSHSA